MSESGYNPADLVVTSGPPVAEDLPSGVTQDKFYDMAYEEMVLGFDEQTIKQTTKILLDQ